MSSKTLKDTDIVLADADAVAAPTSEEAFALLLADIQQNLSLLEKAVNTFEGRFTARVLRTLPSLRRRLSAEALGKILATVLPQGNGTRKSLARYVGEGEAQTTTTTTTITPEAEMYLTLLVIVHLIDVKELHKASELAEATTKVVHGLNRRTLDQLSSRIYFYYVRSYELSGRLPETLPVLLAAQRTAALRHDDDTQATLINLLLRYYFQHGQYEQADRLIAKTPFPEAAGNNQGARYNYYLGRIRALQLEYSAAHLHLLQAGRKAPQTEAVAGFLQAVHKVGVVVQLLMGEIPERSIFRERMYAKALRPYLAITQAVRTGDLGGFQEALQVHGDTFRRDETYTLILRLRLNVIKTGIRMISLSYSRISLRDICLKLHLEGEADAESIVSKAIRDGVIEATIDHAHGYIQSKDTADVYVTAEPQAALHQRISYCLDLHNTSVKAMRYPQDAHKKELALVEDAREREREMVAEIEESGDLDDEDEDMGDF